MQRQGCLSNTKIVAALIGAIAVLCAAIIGIVPDLIKLNDGSRPVSGQGRLSSTALTTVPASITKCNRARVAVAVGVTEQTAFDTDAAGDYSVTAWVADLDGAISELSKCFTSNDLIYVVHVPDLRITPGNPGACKLYLSQVSRLEEYPLGWLIGGDSMIPKEYVTNLRFCYSDKP